MTIETRDFGRVEIDENRIIEFCSPIYGFEELKKYVLLSDDGAGNGLLWLQSVENPQVCFVLLDPDELGLEYYPKLPADCVALLSAVEEKALAILVIAVVPDDFKQTTVNLKSPIVINREKSLAAQVILEADYPIRMHLFESEVGK